MKLQERVNGNRESKLRGCLLVNMSREIAVKQSTIESSPASRKSMDLIKFKRLWKVR